MTCSTEMDFFHSNFMLRTPHEDDHHNQSSRAPILPSCTTPQEVEVVASLLGKRQSMSFSTRFDVYEETNNHCEDELSDDDGSQLGEKKRRLNLEQVKTLEKNFELGNKLEPERKMQLARSLGLKPRQIAIWFQNRRARWKTKQLEKDYEILKKKLEVVKGENDVLQAENQKLHAEIFVLKNKEPTESINLNKETEGSTSNTSENSSEIKLETSRTPAIDSPFCTHPNRPLCQSSLIRFNGDAQQLYQRQENQCPKLIDQTIKEENLCNMFVGMDEQTGFWPWLDHQNFN